MQLLECGHGDHHGSKKEQMKQVIENENLDAPADSVKFLEYMQKHEEKVNHHKKRVHRMSKMMMVFGIAMVVYMGVRNSIHEKRMEEYANEGKTHESQNYSHNKHHKYNGRHHKLGASNEEAESSAYGQTFSAVSVAIWGLVVAKAKTGVEAASKNEAASVGGLVKRVGYICALIAAASLTQFMGHYNTTNPVEAVTKAASSSHKLQASNERHPASYYDKSSSHYMGGGHNVLIQTAKAMMNGEKLPEAPKALRSPNAKTTGHSALLEYAEQAMKNEDNSIRTPSVSSQASMGGAHNVAMAVLAEQSRNFRNQQKKAQQTKSWFSGFKSGNVSSNQFKKNVSQTMGFVGFIGTLAICMTFFVSLKTYHTHLEKKDQLIALLKNPNARVAHGEQGKEIVKKIIKKKQEIEKKEAPKKIIEDLENGDAEEGSIEALIKAAKTKKKVQQVEAVAEKLLSGYEAPSKLLQAAPQPQVQYQLIEPQQAKPVQQLAYGYPQNFEVFAPLPFPQPVQTKVAINQPEPMHEPTPAKANLANMPKAELIKALLLQLSKEDN